MLSAPQLGKTVAIACWLLAQAWARPGSLNWWAAPTYQQDLSGLSALLDLTQSSGILAAPPKTSPGHASMRLIQGSTIDFRSWERAENLSGPTVHALAVDEGHELEDRAWAILRARLAKTGGPIRVIGNTGDSEGTFRDICDTAADPQNRRRMSFYRWTWRDHLRALGGPKTIDGAGYFQTIEDERASLIPSIFAGMYEAEWTANVAAAFPKETLDKGFVPAGRVLPTPGVRYLIAWDIAEAQDYTVGAVFTAGQGEQRRMVAAMRFRRLDYETLGERIEGFSKFWNGAVNVVEANGVGRPVCDRLHAHGFKVVAWITTNENKHAATNRLYADMEDGRVRLLDIQPFRQEFASIRMTRNRSGTYSYSAPEGRHDDCYMAGIIGNWASRFADPAASAVRRLGAA